MSNRVDPRPSQPMMEFSAKFLGEDDFALDLLIWSGEPGDGKPTRHKLPKVEEKLGKWRNLDEPKIGQFFQIRVAQQYAAQHDLASDMTFGTAGTRPSGGGIYG